MKSNIAATIIAILAIISLVAKPGQAAISCGLVDADLIPCVSYLTGRGGDSPSPGCCAAVKTVIGMAQNTPDKRALCSCLKAAANNYADLKDAAAQSMPTKCGVQMDVPISRSVDCDKIV